MASSQRRKNTGGDGASNSLIIPKIKTESKRQELTDAIHYCYKLMLEHGLAVSSISKDTSTLGKFIGQEMFFRIVKLVYDIQFNVSKEAVNEASLVQTPANDVLDEVYVKSEPPSFSVEESNISSIGIDSPSADEGQSTMAPLPKEKVVRAEKLKPNLSTGTQEICIEEASLVQTQANDVLHEVYVKSEPPSPPSFSMEENISSLDDGIDSPSADEGQSTIAPLPKEKVVRAEKQEQEICIEEASLVQTPANDVLGEVSIKSEPPSLPSLTPEESNINTGDGDSIYIQFDDERKPIILPLSPKGENSEENPFSPVLTEVLRGKKRRKSEPPLCTVEESESSDDGDSSYSPSEDESPKPIIPFYVKEKIVRLAELNPGWTIKTLSRISARLKKRSQLNQWKMEVKAGGNKLDKFNLIKKWVVERAKKAKEDSLPITRKALHDWGVEASALYSVKGFKASHAWTASVRKKLK